MALPLRHELKFLITRTQLEVLRQTVGNELVMNWLEAWVFQLLLASWAAETLVTGTSSLITISHRSDLLFKAVCDIRF